MNRVYVIMNSMKGQESAWKDLENELATRFGLVTRLQN